jgi:hypothetical protein
MYALVEAAPQDAHGHGDTGAINCMTAHGSLLLGTPSYLVKDHRFHNAFQIVRPGIPTYDGPALAAMQTTVPVLDDGQQAAYTQVHIDGYMGENASLDRRIFFVKGMLMWVQDTLTPDETMQAQVGPAWQTVAIYPTRGTNWVNTCLITSPLAYIWEQKYLMQWSNLPWDLLVVFLPDGQSTMRIDDVTIDNTQMVTPQPLQNTMKYRLWYQKDTTLQAGIPVRYNSVLLPHAPQQDCTALAAMHSLVLDSADNTMLRITLSTTRSIFLGINDGGNLINTNGIATNARRFLVDVDQTAGVSYWIVDASILITNNKLHFFSGSRRQSKEVVR